LTFLHNRFQAFLKFCAEANDFEEIKWYHLNWDDEISELCQGTGYIINIRNPPFLKQHQSKPIHGKPQGNGKRGNNPAKNLAIQQLFKQGQGNKIIKLAYKNKDYLDALPQGYSICLDYQIRGTYNKGYNCHNKASHSFIPKASFSKFIFWAREIL